MKRSVKRAADKGFRGLDVQTPPTRLEGYGSQLDSNCSHDRRFVLSGRPGLARAAVSRMVYPAYNVHWFVNDAGQDRLMLFCRRGGTIEKDGIGLYWGGTGLGKWTTGP